MTTKNKKQSTEVTQLVDPRAAMKLVRSEVKNAVAGNHRVDEMGYTDRDVARSQIALQDMLTKEQVKRRKAEGHIIELKSILDTLSILSTMVTNDSTNRLLRDQEKLGNMAQELRATSAQNALLHQQQDVLLDENAQLSVDLEAAVNTVRIALNGSTNG